jgi:NADP-dependent 3-hydroxy acid dehydrogenase YdfG
MHPLVKDVHRADPIAMRLIATGAAVVRAARHLVKMAALLTRLGRVRFTDLDELDAVTTELGF